MQVFRFMGMPDKVLAFDSLPESFLKAFEPIRADGFPRHWKEWMGKIKKVTPIPPEKDMLTGGVRRFDPIIEEDSFFYLVDFNLKQNEEKWQELSDYIRRTVDKDVRLLDKIEDMAKPLARDKSEGVSLEPEDVPIIKLPLIAEEEKPVVQIVKAESTESFTCEQCKKTFNAKQGLVMHKMKAHKKEPATV